MTLRQSTVLEFPTMLHGYRGSVRRDVRVQGQRWIQEYLKTGDFTQPQYMLQVPPGEVLIMDPVADPNLRPRPRWRIYMFTTVSRYLNGGVPNEERRRMKEAFESFCLSTPWGAVDYAVARHPPWSLEHMERRFAALLRFWDVLQGPRYGYIPSNTRKFSEFMEPTSSRTLAEVIVYIYGMTMEAWCPGGPASMNGQLPMMAYRLAGAPREMTLETWCPGGPAVIRDHLARMVERMARASREECVEAVLRVSSSVVKQDTRLKHREVLGDPDFLRERLAGLGPDDWENLSGADPGAVGQRLFIWDEQLERH